MPTMQKNIITYQFIKNVSHFYYQEMSSVTVIIVFNKANNSEHLKELNQYII